jgi:uncharacterized protein YgiM (DUF1202 family)
MIRNKVLKTSIVLLFFLTGFKAIAEQKEFVIAGQKIFLRDKPSFLGKSVFATTYGAKVALLKKSGGWLQVKLDNQIGWVHQSSVQDGYYILKDIGKGAATSKDTYKDEVVTAGKGFSPEYEAMMKSNNPNLNYKTVDQIENYKVPVENLVNFEISGGLKSEILK